MTILARTRTACAIALIAVAAVLATSASAQQFGTAAEAKAMLEKTVSALKADKAKTLELINEGKGGFLDRDLIRFASISATARTLQSPAPMQSKCWDWMLGPLRTLPACCLARIYTPRRKNRKVKSLRLATCGQGQGPTKRQLRR
jgi:hypothetical protein